MGKSLRRKNIDALFRSPGPIFHRDENPPAHFVVDRNFSKPMQMIGVWTRGSLRFDRNFHITHNEVDLDAALTDGLETAQSRAIVVKLPSSPSDSDAALRKLAKAGSWRTMPSAAISSFK